MTCRVQADPGHQPTEGVSPQPVELVQCCGWSTGNPTASEPTVTCQVKLNQVDREALGSSSGKNFYVSARRAVHQAGVALDLWAADDELELVQIKVTIIVTDNGETVAGDIIAQVRCRGCCASVCVPAAEHCQSVGQAIIAAVNQAIGAVPSADIPEVVASGVGSGSCYHCYYEGAD